MVRLEDVWHGGGGTVPQRARVATRYNQGCGVLWSKKVGKRKGGDLGVVTGSRSFVQPEYCYMEVYGQAYIASYCVAIRLVSEITVKCNCLRCMTSFSQLH